MPTYEYQCKSCSHRFEIWQKMTAEPLAICPECNGPIRRVLFPAGIVFKGSGFYKTDHGSGAVISESNQNGQTEKKESTAKAEGASETKASSEKAATSASTSESQVSAAAD